MGALLGRLCNAAFCLTFGLNTLVAAAIMKLATFLPMSKKSKEEWALRITRLFWMMSFRQCPWIRITKDPSGWEDWDALRQKMQLVDAEVAAGRANPRPVFVLSNHTSFLDVPLMVSFMPYWAYVRSRAYMSDHLLKIPVLSTICRCIGHFVVYFASAAEGAFKLDTQKMEVVEKQVDAFMDDGGYMAIYPEGQINKNPDTIMPLRYGGIKRALERDAAITLLVFYGNTKVWPRKALISGRPGHIRYGTRVVSPDGCRAYVKALREAGLPEEERELPDHALLAKRLQASLQEMYDRYRAEVTGKAVGETAELLGKATVETA